MSQEHSLPTDGDDVTRLPHARGEVGADPLNEAVTVLLRGNARARHDEREPKEALHLQGSTFGSRRLILRLSFRRFLDPIPSDRINHNLSVAWNLDKD
jgi:hypothetical protein